jgi:hypothetical protein
VITHAIEFVTICRQQALALQLLNQVHSDSLYPCSLKER